MYQPNHSFEIGENCLIVFPDSSFEHAKIISITYGYSLLHNPRGFCMSLPHSMYSRYYIAEESIVYEMILGLEYRDKPHIIYDIGLNMMTSKRIDGKLIIYANDYE